MEKLEAKFTTQKLQPYIKAKLKPNFNWECKYVRTTNYAFRSDKSFQKELRSLLIGENKGICYKHPDSSFNGTMFDGFYIKAPGYFFIYYEKSKLTYKISVKNMLMIVESESKSLSENTAKIICDEIIKI
jgi:hypothetical protein